MPRSEEEGVNLLPRSSGVSIIACGKYIPQHLMTNESLSKECNVNAGWIEQRTGIRTRYYLGSKESASIMASLATQRALEQAQIKADEIGLIICCSCSGDYRFPPLACKVQQIIQANRAGAFDLSAGSAGFVIAMMLGADRLKSEPTLKNILIVTCAAQSPFLDRSNPQTAVLFGDGAASVILSFVPQDYGIQETEIFSNGEAFDAVRLRGGGSSFPLDKENIGSSLQYIEMDGIAMGKQYMKYQPFMIERVLKKARLSMKDIDLFLFHPPNFRTVKFLVSKLNLSMAKTFTNVETYGNTSDASVALALCDAVEKGLIKRGHRILLSGVGPGVVFAASILRWY